jgi:hypothetical protein
MKPSSSLRTSIPSRISSARGGRFWVRPLLLRRSDLDDVGHVDLRAVDPGLFEQLVEQLPGVAYEGTTLLDLLLARCLSHDGEPGAKGSFAEDRVLAEPFCGSFLELLPFPFLATPITPLVSCRYSPGWQAGQ